METEPNPNPESEVVSIQPLPSSDVGEVVLLQPIAQYIQDSLIIVRFGHGKNTKGKEAPDGTKEYTLNKAIGERFMDKAKDKGYSCVLANPYDYEDDNANRALEIVIGHINRIAQNAKGKRVICIDIHCNAHQPNFPKLEFNSASGTVTFFFERGSVKSKEGERLAIAIHEQMVKQTGLSDRAWSFNRGKAVGENFGVLRETHCPTVTVECAFMTNRSDLAYLKSEEGQKAIAQAILNGIDNYFKHK